MVKYIIIKTQFAATHCWPAAENYLRHEHRHVFHVKMQWEVTHNDRQIEFIEQKEEVEKFINLHLSNRNLGSTSCEDIAETLLNIFKADHVSVLEDNENGAVIINTER